MADPAAPSPAAPSPSRGLADEDVRQRLGRIEVLLGQLEAGSGPTAEAAMAVVEALTEVYGTALARMVAMASGYPGLAASFAGDELVGHLMILHGVHPRPAEERVARALDEIRPYIRSHGGDVELAGIDGGVARVRLSGSCDGCASSAATLEQAVTSVVLAAAPELTGVEKVAVPGGHAEEPAARPHSARPHSAPLIPAESLLRKPASLAAPGGPGR
jgi:Fe-S cluster biogenesis protein NfuA